MPTFLASLRHRYDACSPREKRLLALAVLVVSAALLFVLADGMLAARDRLDRALPEARARLERLREESEALAQAGPAAESTSAASLEALQASAKARGLAAEIKSSGEGYALNGTADGAAVLEWLATLQQQWRLRPQRVALNREAGGVRFDILLAPSHRD